MTLRNISILNFKNIAEAALDFSGGVNCFIGGTFGQIFITDTNRTHLDHIIRRMGKDYRTWSVNKGNFTLIEEDRQ